MKEQMEKYKLVSQVGIGTKEEIILDDFTTNDYNEFENNKLDPQKQSELLTMAIDMQGFEWWIEKV